MKRASWNKIFREYLLNNVAAFVVSSGEIEMFYLWIVPRPLEGGCQLLTNEAAQNMTAACLGDMFLKLFFSCFICILLFFVFYSFVGIDVVLVTNVGGLALHLHFLYIRA